MCLYSNLQQQTFDVCLMTRMRDLVDFYHRDFAVYLFCGYSNCFIGAAFFLKENRNEKFIQNLFWEPEGKTRSLSDRTEEQALRRPNSRCFNYRTSKQLRLFVLLILGWERGCPVLKCLKQQIRENGEFLSMMVTLFCPGKFLDVELHYLTKEWK
jgi:hypothetical protein